MNPLRSAAALLFTLSPGLTVLAQLTSPVVDTGQTTFYNDVAEMAGPPSPGQPFYGQDAQYGGTAMAYHDNEDGTVTDLRTGLMWQKTPEYPTRRTWADAHDYADAFTLAGHEDWRLPTVKELYSIIAFWGRSAATAEDSIPYLDTVVFDFEYPVPDPPDGLRLIDGQYWSSTKYVGLTMIDHETAFGVNFADGRIKGYATETSASGAPFTAYVRCVRGRTDYGVNDFDDNDDGTVTDHATGLMWMKNDSATAMNWQDALAYADALGFAGHSDWRVPDAKELQGIVDYTRAPDAIDLAAQGPAIDPIFLLHDDDAWGWTSTTLLEPRPGQPLASEAVYLCFGQAWGYVGPPGMGSWMNVHGAGAQRSDPKSGDPAIWPYGSGPQNDEVRILNSVRCVRDTCPADVDGDGVVGFGDLLAVLAHWDEGPGSPADLDDDGVVGFSDVLTVLTAWGPCP